MMETIPVYPYFLQIIGIGKCAQLACMRYLGQLSYMNEITFTVRTSDVPLDNSPQIQSPSNNSNLII